jgi:hypothetical protein
VRTLLCITAKVFAELTELAHSRHFEREVGMTASPHKSGYTADITQ